MAAENHAWRKGRGALGKGSLTLHFTSSTVTLKKTRSPADTHRSSRVDAAPVQPHRQAGQLQRCK